MRFTTAISFLLSVVSMATGKLGEEPGQISTVEGDQSRRELQPNLLDNPFAIAHQYADLIYTAAGAEAQTMEVTNDGFIRNVQTTGSQGSCTNTMCWNLFGNTVTATVAVKIGVFGEKDVVLNANLAGLSGEKAMDPFPIPNALWRFFCPEVSQSATLESQSCTCIDFLTPLGTCTFNATAFAGSGTEVFIDDTGNCGVVKGSIEILCS